MCELKEDSVKFLLMFMEAHHWQELDDAIQEHKTNTTMKEMIEATTETFDFDTFDFTEMSDQLRKHIPALSDTQLDHAIGMCKLEKDNIRSRSQLIQVLIDHL